MASSIGIAASEICKTNKKTTFLRNQHKFCQREEGREREREGERGHREEREIERRE
jgi:hypothetical protein